MISILRFKEILDSMVLSVNNSLADKKLSIEHSVLSVTDAQVVKKLGDKKGVVLVAKMPPSTGSIQNEDAYAENNQVLLFILERQEPASVNAAKELTHYASMQTIMAACKEFILNYGYHNTLGDQETISKAFRTEWEFQVYGNFNGLSLSFDLMDFGL